MGEVWLSNVFAPKPGNRKVALIRGAGPLDLAVIQHTCALYGRPWFKSVDAARAAMLKERSGGPDGNINLKRSIDLSLLPPCKKALLQHIKHANFQVGIWKAASIPQPSTATTSRWTWVEDGCWKTPANVV